MMDESLQDYFRQLLPRYTYKGLDWVIDQVGKPEIYLKEKAVVIPGFYHEKGYSDHGVCNELMVQAFQDIQDDHPELYSEGRLLRVRGGDPLYYSSPPHTIRKLLRDKQIPRQESGTHLFLAITKERIAEEGKELKGKKARMALEESDGFIFDPSYGVFEPYKDSNYFIDTIWTPKAESSHSRRQLTIDQKFKHNYVTLGQEGGINFGINVQITGKPKNRKLSTHICFNTPGNKNSPSFGLWNNHLDFLAKSVDHLGPFLEYMRDQFSNPLVCEAPENGIHRSISVT